MSVGGDLVARAVEPPTGLLAAGVQGMLIVMMAESGDRETRVLVALQWIFFTLGLGSLIAFLFDPDIHAHPELVLLAGTGLLGSLTLRALAGLFGSTVELD